MCYWFFFFFKYFSPSSSSPSRWLSQGFICSVFSDVIQFLIVFWCIVSPFPHNTHCLLSSREISPWNHIFILLDYSRFTDFFICGLYGRGYSFRSYWSYRSSCSSLVDVHILGAFYQFRQIPNQQELKAEWSRLWKMKTPPGWAPHHLREALGNTLSLEKQDKPSLRWTWGWDPFQLEFSDLSDLNSFCTAKESINKMKRQPTEWEKIIANEATNTGLISKIYMARAAICKKKINNPSKKNEQKI